MTFLDYIAEGAEAKGALVLKLDRTAPAHLVILPGHGRPDQPYLMPLVVEARVKKGGSKTVHIEGGQVGWIRKFQRIDPLAVPCLLVFRHLAGKKGEMGNTGEITYTINGKTRWNETDPEQPVYLFLLNAWDLGRSAYLARKGLMRVDASPPSTVPPASGEPGEAKGSSPLPVTVPPEG